MGIFEMAYIQDSSTVSGTKDPDFKGPCLAITMRLWLCAAVISLTLSMLFSPTFALPIDSPSADDGGSAGNHGGPGSGYSGGSNGDKGAGDDVCDLFPMVQTETADRRGRSQRIAEAAQRAQNLSAIPSDARTRTRSRRKPNEKSSCTYLYRVFRLCAR